MSDTKLSVLSAILLVSLGWLAFWQHKTAEYWRKQYDAVKAERESFIRQDCHYFSEGSTHELRCNPWAWNDKDHVGISMQWKHEPHKYCIDPNAKDGSMVLCADVGNINTIYSTSAQVATTAVFAEYDKTVFPVAGQRILIARGDIGQIVAACKVNPHRTEMVSADSSWDIPIDCKRMLKTYGRAGR